MERCARTGINILLRTLLSGPGGLFVLGLLMLTANRDHLTVDCSGLATERASEGREGRGARVRQRTKP